MCSGGPIHIILPIGSSPGQKRRAIASFTTATGGLLGTVGGLEAPAGDQAHAQGAEVVATHEAVPDRRDLIERGRL